MTETRGADGGRRDRDLVVRGRLTADAGGPGGPEDTADLSLSIPASTIVAGRGPADLAVDMPSLRLRGGTIEWIVRTTTGWTHIGGTATSGDSPIPTMFRLDLLHDRQDLTVARATLRVYPPESEGDAGGAPPIVRIAGVLAPAGAPVGPGTASE